MTALRDDLTTRAAYVSDASIYRRLPAAVAEPRSVQEIRELLATAREHPQTGAIGCAITDCEPPRDHQSADFNLFPPQIGRPSMAEAKERLFVCEPCRGAADVGLFAFDFYVFMKASRRPVNAYLIGFLAAFAFSLALFLMEVSRNWQWDFLIAFASAYACSLIFKIKYISALNKFSFKTYSSVSSIKLV